MEFTVGADLPLAVPVTSGNVVSAAHEIMENCYGMKLTTTNTRGLKVQQESPSPAEKPSPAAFHLSPVLSKASGSLLRSLECQRHAYYNCIEPVSSFFLAPY